MLPSVCRDEIAEFVIDQLSRVQWISGYTFKEGHGYELQWLPLGCHRMMLLQIALSGERSATGELEDLNGDALTRDAIRDFWNACTTQLELRGERGALPVFVNIIKKWTPRG